MSTLLTGKVQKTPSAEVSADRYVFLKLSEAEPDLGLPAVSGYVLSSTTTGTRSWVAQSGAEPVAAGTDGQITYNNGGTSAGAASLYYDDVNGRLGVNTVIPTATLDVAGDIAINSDVLLNSTAAIRSTVTPTVIAAFSASVYGSGKFVIQAYDTVDGERFITELLITHDGTTAIATEYGSLYTGVSALANYQVDITSGNVRLLAIGSSTHTTEYKVYETLFTV